MHLLGRKLRRSTAYHPQTDGQTKVVNQSVETYLCCFAMGTPKQWSKWLPWAEFSYNTTHHTSTQVTPFEVVYGRPPPPLLQYEKGSSLVHEIDRLLHVQDTMISKLKESLLKAQQRMIKATNTKRRDVHYEVNDWVYLKLRPYRQSSLGKHNHPKLAPRFVDPFHVIAKVGPVAYRLELPQDASIHPVFHVSMLRKVVRTNFPIFPIPPLLGPDLSIAITPAIVLGLRQSLTKDMV